MDRNWCINDFINFCASGVIVLESCYLSDIRVSVSHLFVASFRVVVRTRREFFSARQCKIGRIFVT